MADRLPAPIPDADMVRHVADLVLIIRERMTAPSSFALLKALLVADLASGFVEIPQAVAWADAGDPLADAALRQLYAEMRDRREVPTVTLEAYAIKVMRQGPVPRGRGHRWFNDWVRNCAIAALVQLTVVTFQLAPTRNREQRRRKQPSACSVVSAALGKHRINVTEKTVENVYGKLRCRIPPLADMPSSC